MVYHDLSLPRPSPKSLQLRVPSVFDRNLAFLIDFLVFSPILGFFTAFLSQKLKLNLILEAGTTELLAIWFLMFALVFSGTVFMQALCWFRYGATPGQRFLQLQVVNFPNSGLPLTFTQCLLRSVLWFLSAVFFLVPFIEILGHPLRRALHERASDTMVVTLKQTDQEVPHPIESRFIRSWLTFFFSGVLLLFALFTFGIYTDLIQGKFAESTSASYLCEEVDGFSATSDRIEVAVVQYLGKQISASCLNKEADYLLWFARDQELKNWALLTKAIVSPSKELRTSYEKVLCEKDQKPFHCQILKMTQANSQSKLRLNSKLEDHSALAVEPTLSKELTRSKLVQFLKTRALFSEKKYLEAAQAAQSLRQIEGLQALGNVYYVKSLIQMLRSEQELDRRPASLESEVLIQSFLEELEEQ